MCGSAAAAHYLWWAMVGLCCDRRDGDCRDSPYRQGFLGAVLPNQRNPFAAYSFILASEAPVLSCFLSSFCT